MAGDAAAHQRAGRRGRAAGRPQIRLGAPHPLPRPAFPLNGHATPLPQGWHTDYGGCVRPSYATLLYGINVPAGLTEFADLCGAYDRLPAEQQEECGRATVLYSQRRAYAPGGELYEDYTPESEWLLQRRPDVEHPLVRTIPQTGRPAL